MIGLIYFEGDQFWRIQLALFRDGWRRVDQTDP